MRSPFASRRCVGFEPSFEPGEAAFFMRASLVEMMRFVCANFLVFFALPILTQTVCEEENWIDLRTR